MAEIEVKNLCKRYFHLNKHNKQTEKIVVNDLNFAVEKSEVFGLLGPNGAGKTTTIRMMTGQILPTQGEIFYNGVPLSGNELAVKERIGVVPQHINFDQDLTVAENLELHARLWHISGKERSGRIKAALDFADMNNYANDNIRNLSGGMKRRLIIARALIHRPDALFLDEPTVALDPQVRRRIWQLIRQKQEDGATIILTTHYIEEAEALCNRVAILNHGEMVVVGKPSLLCEKIGRYVAESDDGNGRVCNFFRSRAEAVAFAGELTGSVKIRPTSLEDVFIELTGRDGIL